MTTQPTPPRTLTECAGMMSDAAAALRATGLTPEQRQHVSTLINGYLYASKLATKSHNLATEYHEIAVDALKS